MLPERLLITRAAWLSGENRADKGGFVPEKGGFVSLSQLVRNRALLLTKPII